MLNICEINNRYVLLEVMTVCNQFGFMWVDFILKELFNVISLTSSECNGFLCTFKSNKDFWFWTIMTIFWIYEVILYIKKVLCVKVLFSI